MISRAHTFNAEKYWPKRNVIPIPVELIKRLLERMVDARIKRKFSDVFLFYFSSFPTCGERDPPSRPLQPRDTFSVHDDGVGSSLYTAVAMDICMRPINGG